MEKVLSDAAGDALEPTFEALRKSLKNSCGEVKVEDVKTVLGLWLDAANRLSSINADDDTIYAMLTWLISEKHDQLQR